MDRIVVSGRKRAQRRETCEAHRRDGRLSTAADHRVSIAALDNFEAVANRMRARRAGGGRCRVWPFRVMANGNLSGGEIDDGRRNKERRDATGAVFQELLVFTLDGPEIPDAAA